MGVQYRTPIEIRGFKVFLRPLSQAEQLQVYCDVSASLHRLPEMARNQITEHTLICQKTLVTASTTEPGKLDFQLSDALLEQFTFDELSFLFKQYVFACEKVNPAFDELKDDEITAMVNAVKKNPASMIDLSSLQLVNVCRRLLSELPKDNSVGG